MRGVAAWSVVIGHMAQMALPVAGSHPYFLELASITGTFANAGVDMFFVISGAIMFIITHQAKPPNRVVAVGDFLLRRALRIYPLFWITLAFTLYSGVGVWPANWNAALRSLTLIDMPPSHPVAWTLIFEVRFYLMVAVVLLVFSGRVAAGFAVWACLFASALFFASYGVLPFSWFTHPLMMEFIMGVVVGALICRGTGAMARTCLLVGCAWMVGTCAFVFKPENVETMRMAGYGLPSALILYGVVGMEKRGLLSTPRFLRSLGDTSYSVYLWHYGIIWMLSHALPQGHAGYGALFLLTAVPLVFGVGWLSYRVIELPMMRAAKDISARLSRSLRPAPNVEPTL